MQYIKFTLALCAIVLFAVPGCRNENGDAPFTEEIEETEGELQQDVEQLDEAEQDVQESEGELEEARGEFAQTRERFLQLTAAKLAALDARIEELRVEVEQRTTPYEAEQRERIIEALTVLNEKRTAAIQAFQAAQTGTQQEWEQIETSAADALRDADAAYEDLAEAVRQPQ